MSERAPPQQGAVMFPRVAAVRHLRDHRLELTFTSGERAELDLKDMIVGRGGVFAALEDVEEFRRVEVDEGAGTLVWPNGVDFCPDVLYSRATGTRIPEAEIQPSEE